MRPTVFLHFFAILILFIFLTKTSVFSQNTFDGSVSLQFGPETGMSLIMPKMTIRKAEDGLYFGGFVSSNFVSLFTLSAGPIVGARWRGVACESSLSFTFESFEENKKTTNRFWLNFNPKIIVGYRPVFISFGPSIYLYKSKREGITLWKNISEAKVGQWLNFNYELGFIIPH